VHLVQVAPTVMVYQRLAPHHSAPDRPVTRALAARVALPVAVQVAMVLNMMHRTGQVAVPVRLRPV
jgi:hypothetical protein